MKQLNLTIYGETDYEILYYLLMAAKKLRSNAIAGRIQEVRPSRGGRPAITTMAKYDLAEDVHAERAARHRSFTRG